MKVMQVIQECPEILDFDLIRKKLIETNWNVNEVIKGFKDQNSVKIRL